MPFKPGFKTSEFLGKCAVEVGVLAAALAGSLSPKWAAVSIAVSEGAYAVSRGLAKRQPHVVTPSVPPAPPASPVQ